MYIFNCKLVIDASEDRYIPQIFAEKYPKWIDNPEYVQILLAGPDHERYFEVWHRVTIYYKEHEGRYLAKDSKSDGLLMCEYSPMDYLVKKLANKNQLDKEGCPDEIKESVVKVCSEFVTSFLGGKDEDEALEWFKPSDNKDANTNKALEWISFKLREIKELDAKWTHEKMESFTSGVNSLISGEIGVTHTPYNLAKLQERLDLFCLRWKNDMGVLPMVVGRHGRGRLRRLTAEVPRPGEVVVHYDIEGDEEHIELVPPIFNRIWGVIKMMFGKYD